MKFVDIHTHREVSGAGQYAVVNIHSRFEQQSPGTLCSMGLHPWYLDDADSNFLILKKAAEASHVLAIGECGLDTVCKTDYKKQQEYFIQQIKLANELNKPLIIHCVRSLDGVLRILKEQKVQVNVVFHGFNSSPEKALRILAEGYYLSFGKHLFNERIKEVFRSVPADRMLLETDHAACSISEIYSVAAQTLEMTQDELALRIDQNVFRIFGKWMIKQ